MNTLHSFEIPLIEFIQKFRNLFLDDFFKILDYFDNFYFTIFIIAIIWVGYDRKWGVKIFFIIILSTILNFSFKLLFKSPRPFELIPSLFVIDAKNYGFPSGHAQTAVLYAGIMVKYLKNKKFAWIFGLSLIFLISLSRIYFGVHFLTDILGGWIIALFLLWIFFYIFPKIEVFIKSTKPIYLFLMSQIFALLFLFSKEPQSFCVFVGILSVGLGLFLSYLFDLFLPSSKSFLEGVLRSFVVLSGFILLFFVELSFNIYLFLIIYFLGLWISFFSNLILKNLQRFLKI